MSMHVKLKKDVIVVPSGAVTYVVDELIAGKMDIDGARNYLAKEEIKPGRQMDLGYIDFVNLVDGKPTIVGEFYKSHTRAGLKLTGKWDERLSKVKKSQET